MEVIYANILDALRRVQGFLDAQATALGSVIPASLRARLDGAVTQLAAFQVEQSAADGTARGEAANQVVLRKSFCAQFFQPIARIAKRSLKTVGEYPTLSVASARLKKSDFAAAAQALADSAAKYEKTFLDGGMQADFLAQMRAAIAQMATSKDAQDRNDSRGIAATQGIKDTDKIAHEVLVVLDSMIVPVLKHNASLLADWKASKRIAGVTPLPPQPTGLPATSTVIPPVVTTPAPTAPTATPAVAPAEQATKPAA